MSTIDIGQAETERLVVSADGKLAAVSVIFPRAITFAVFDLQKSQLAAQINVPMNHNRNFAFTTASGVALLIVSFIDELAVYDPLTGTKKLDIQIRRVTSPQLETHKFGDLIPLPDGMFATVTVAGKVLIYRLKFEI